MLRDPVIRRTALALAVPCALLPHRVHSAVPVADDPRAPPPPTAAKPPSLADLYSRGEAAFDAGDLDAAVDAFGQGLTRADADPKSPPRVRTYFRVSLAIALYERFLRAGAAGRVEDLDRARDLLLQATTDEAKILAQDPTLEALARRNLDAVEKALRRRRPPPPRVRPAAPARPDPVQLEAVRHDRRVGIGLLVSGTAVVAGGIAVLVDGLTLKARALAIAEDPPMGRQKEYIDNEVPRLAAIRYAIAGPALALGVAFVAAGSALLVRAARKARGRRAGRRLRPGRAGRSVPSVP